MGDNPYQECFVGRRAMNGCSNCKDVGCAMCTVFDEPGKPDDLEKIRNQLNELQIAVNELIVEKRERHAMSVACEVVYQLDERVKSELRDFSSMSVYLTIIGFNSLPSPFKYYDKDRVEIYGKEFYAFLDEHGIRDNDVFIFYEMIKEYKSTLLPKERNTMTYDEVEKEMIVAAGLCGVEASVATRMLRALSTTETPISRL